MVDWNGLRLGVRWDDQRQDERIRNAKAAGLLDYVEVNYPISTSEDPSALGLPILAHTSNNPIASAVGLDPDVVKSVGEGASQADSPWVGEHLAWLSEDQIGALGYVLNPILLPEFVDHSVENIALLKKEYGRQVALELGPTYGVHGVFESEMHFLAEVSRRADTGIILDVTHWMISNRNLGRGDRWGLDVIDGDRVMELHIAGMRSSNSGTFWHDAHGLPLLPATLEALTEVLDRFPGVKAVTFEHSIDGPEQEFIADLERLRDIVQ